MALAALAVIGAVLPHHKSAPSSSVAAPDAASASAPEYLFKRPAHMGHDAANIALFGDSTLLSDLHWSDTWCAWKGSHVVVHATFRNTSNADLAVQVAPTYALVEAGTHGDSLTLDLNVPAHHAVDWLGDAGQPQGVTRPVRFTGCDPMVWNVKPG